MAKQRPCCSKLAQGLCIEPEDASQLVQAVQRLVKDPGEAQQMGQNGRAFVANHYDRNVLAQQYLQLICRVAGHEFARTVVPQEDQVVSEGPPTPTRG